MPLEADITKIPSDEEADVKSTGEVVEEEEGGEVAAASDGGGGEAERSGAEEEEDEDEDATPSTPSEDLDDSDSPSEPAPRHEPADPFTRHTLTWNADTVERGVELTCQGKLEARKAEI